MAITIDMFGKGSIWQNRKGAWKVISNDGKIISAEYINTNEQLTFNNEIKTLELINRIHDNIERETENHRKKIFGIKDIDNAKLNELSESKLYFTLGFLSKNCSLRIRTVPNTNSRADARYFNATGKQLADEPDGYEFDTCPNTWSTKIYLKFKDISIDKIKYLYLPENIEGNSLLYKDDGIYYYNTEWGWLIIEDFGFRLGKQKNIDEIKKTIPLEYMSDFEIGLRETI